MGYADSSGRSLADYPRPSLAVDVALLTLDPDGRLAVLLHERTEKHATGELSLPGTFVHHEERLRDAALRALRTKVGVTGQEPRQLKVFDEPKRDHRGWVMSVAHVDLVPPERLAPDGVLAPDCLLAPVAGDPARAELPEGHDQLAFDHAEIIADAVDWARKLYERAPDPRHLIGDEFVLFDLQRVHQAISHRAVHKDTFRRHMLPQLLETGELRRGLVGKPARVFRRKPNHDVGDAV